MQLSPADQAAMISAVGETVTIGGVSVTADFRTESAPVQVFEGRVMSSSPVCRVTAADFTASSIDYGTPITARGIDYAVSEIRQEQSGFYLLALVK